MAKIPTLSGLRDLFLGTSSAVDYIPLAQVAEKQEAATAKGGSTHGQDTITTASASPSRIQVIATVTFHICSAMSVTLLNKWALNNIPLPQVLLAFQSGICVAMSVGVKMAGLGNIGTLALPLAEVHKLWIYLFMRTVGVGMKVWCLNLVPASFYAVSRGLLLPITALLSYLILRSKASPGVLANIAVICVGFVIGAGSKHGSSVSGSTLSILSDPGFILGIASTFTTGLETIVVKTFGPKLSVYRAVYVTSLAGFLAFSLLSYVSGGFHQFHDLVAASRITTPGHTSNFVPHIVVPIIISGGAYYLVSLAAVLQITVTSPVTHTISTAVRGVLQSLLAVLLLPNESLSMASVISIGFILAGSGGYTWIKEKNRQEKQSQTGRLG